VSEIVVASYNVHGGVDGWGRPYDVEAVCRRIDADVLVLQESWRPDHGVGLAEGVGEALGYAVTSFALSRCRMFSPASSAGAHRSWGPRPWGGTGRERGMDLRRWDGSSERRSRRTVATAEPVRRDGSWDLAVLTRLESPHTEVWDLGVLRRDVGRRGAIAVDVVVPGRDRTVTIVGTHMSHLSHGSPTQFRRLRRRLPTDPGDVVLTGDMNLWGPPLSVIFPGYRRAVRGRTWPAWRPLVQSGHVLVSKHLAARAVGEVLPLAGSDHLPVRARIEL